MTRLVLLALLVTTLSSVSGHQCMHDHVVKSMYGDEPERVIAHDTRYAASDRRLQSQDDHQDMRITLDFSRLDNPAEERYMCAEGFSNAGRSVDSSDGMSTHKCSRDDELTAAKRVYLQDILNDAAEWWSTTLAVDRVVGNLQLSAGSTCNTPSNGLHAPAYLCCSSQLPTRTIPNSDFVFFVTARPTGSTVLAWALSCQYDSQGRPVAGHINFSPASIQTASRDRNRQFSTALHEMAHAFGFSNSLFSTFRNSATGQQWGRENVVQSFMERGSLVSKIVTPTVVAKAKELLDCNNWANAGLELEGYGGSGSQGSHWEKRITNNEFMAATISMNPIRSAFTLALFQDMGWYSVNYAKAQILPWGYQKGCGFATNKCDAWDASYFCTSNSQTGCTVDRTAKAYCNKATYSSAIPAEHRYFEDTVTGGGDPYLDFCPVFQGYRNGDCRDQGYSATFVRSQFKEVVGDASRCFLVGNVPVCYPVECTSSNALNVIVDNVKYSCPTNGGIIVAGSFQVKCPPATEICSLPESFCNNGAGCSGAGTCGSDGQCICTSGRTGAGCEQRVCPKAIQNGLECNTGAICPSGSSSCCNRDTGSCACANGYGGSTCEEALCEVGTSGSICSGHGQCENGQCQCSSSYTGDDCSDVPGCATGGCNQGECDTTTGACACEEGYFGKACTSQIVPTVETLPLHVGNTTFTRGQVGSKEFAFFETFVNGSIYDITITVRTLSGDADVYVLYTREEEQAFPNTESHMWSSSRYGDTAVDVVHICGTYDFFPRGSGDSLCLQRDPFFLLDRAKLRIGVLGFEYEEAITEFEIAVEQDECVNVGCSEHGRCDGGICYCDPLWTGTVCDIPDCPGTPDCSNHGDCLVLPGNKDPECVCSFGFVDDDCSKLAPGFESPPISLPAGGTVALPDAVDGYFKGATGTGNWTYFEVIVPANATVGDTSLFVNLVEYGVDECPAVDTGSYNGCGRGDAVLFAQREVLPQLSSYADFDANSWTTASNSHRMLLDSTSGLVKGRWYIGVFNSAYAKSRLFYDILIDTSTRCSNELDCSGHGSCSLEGDTLTPTCECDEGYSGALCDNFVIPLEPDQILDDRFVSDVALLPNEWAHYSISVTPELLAAVEELENAGNRTADSNGQRQLVVEMETLPKENEDPDSVVSSFANQPILILSVGSKPPNLNSLGVIDYNAWSSKQRKQRVTFESSQLTPRTLYFGVHHRHYATSSVNIRIRVAIASPQDNELYLNCLPQHGETDVPCYGRGSCLFEEATQEPKCTCQSGWSGRLCNNPVMGALTGLQSAAQDVQHLCSTCSTRVELAREQFKLYRIPQPIQAGQGTQIYVRSLVNNTGDVDLYLAQQLPRSMYDFVFIESNNGGEETMVISNVSPTGPYFLAVYARSSGPYEVTVSKVLLGDDDGSITDKELVTAVGLWLTTSSVGKATLAAIVILCASIFGCGLFVVCRGSNFVRTTADLIGFHHSVPVADEIVD